MSSQLLKSEIVQFYRGKNVLITGSLGFCGRVRNAALTLARD